MYFLDLLNPDAVRYYMKISYTDVWERFADEFGKTIVSVWVDEPHFNLPFCPDEENCRSSSGRCGAIAWRKTYGCC